MTAAVIVNPIAINNADFLLLKMRISKIGSTIRQAFSHIATPAAITVPAMMNDVRWMFSFREA